MQISPAVHSEFHPGVAAMLTGLKSAVDLNGQEVICGAWDTEKGRIEVRLASGEVKNVRPSNLTPSPKRGPIPSPNKNPRQRLMTATDIASTPKKRKRGEMPKMDFDAKTNLDASDLFKKDVFFAVKAYVDEHPDSWSLSLMCHDISEDKGWENNEELARLVQASLLKNGISAKSAFRGGPLKTLNI